MKKKILSVLLASIFTCYALTGCIRTQAQRVSYNLSQEAENFNIVRQLTVINCIEGDVLFQMTGRMSITADTADNQLEIIVENDVEKYKYTLNFNPKMWIPVNVDVID